MNATSMSFEHARLCSLKTESEIRNMNAVNIDICNAGKSRDAAEQTQETNTSMSDTEMSG